MTEPRRLGRLGRYELLEQLGEGGMGSVFLARLTGAAGFEKLCIVKTVLPSIAKDAEFVSRFLHEGRVLTQLSHGNIAQVLDMNEAEGQLFLALEYVAGVDLARLHEQVRAAKEYMPLPLVVALITQAAEGLGAAHRKHALDGSPLNIVHRDVSPHNVMVSYEGEVKVIDFGIAKSEARSRHTAQASVMGKLGYMAPEQARGEPVDHRADQYALSIVAWELLANESWVRRGTLTEMVVAMANPTIRMLAPLRSDVPPSLEAVILKALSPLPAGRYASTDEFAQVLMGELLKLGAPPTKPQLGEYVRSRCSTDFATTRSLLTRVSTQRSPPPDGERTRPELPPATGSHAVTAALRPGGPPAQPITLEHLAPPVPTEPGRPGVAAPAVLQEPGEPGATSPARPAAMARANEPEPLVPERPSVRVDVQAISAPLTTGEMAAASSKRSPVLFLGAGLVLGLLVAVAIALRPVSTEAAPDAGVVAAAVVDAGVLSPHPDPLPVREREEVPEAVPEFPPEQPTLEVSGRLAGNAWVLTNRGSRNWTSCKLTLPKQRVGTFGTLPRGSTELPLSRFRFDANAYVLEGQARVDCAQGFGLIQLPR